jgi:hypothetical protein
MNRFQVHPWQVLMFVGVVMIIVSIFRIGHETKTLTLSQCAFELERAITTVEFLKERADLIHARDAAMLRSRPDDAARTLSDEIYHLDLSRIAYLNSHLTSAGCPPAHSRAQETQ